MCVMEHKTYIYQDQRRQTVHDYSRCNNAPPGGLCNHVRVKNSDAARVEERRPNVERPSSSSTNIIMADGREYRYYPRSRRSSKRSSTGRRPAGNSGGQSPIDSLVSTSPPQLPSRTVRPRAPSPPAPRSERRVSFHEPVVTRAEISDGTAVYTDPPSLSMSRASINEKSRRSLHHTSSISSLTNEIDDTEPPSAPPLRRPSIKRNRRPTGLDLGLETAKTSSSQSSPGLSDLPKIDRDRPSAGTTSPPLRSGSSTYRPLEDLAREEEERQARLVRDSLAATEQRQHDRLSRHVRQSARKHSQDLSRDSPSEEKAKHRQATAAILTGESPKNSRRQERNREIDRRIEAEMAQIKREAEAAERRRVEYQQQQYSSSPTSARVYTYMPTSPPTTISRRPISARTVTDTSSPTPSARTPRYGSAIVHQPIRPRDPLAEQGERVIQREQARVADSAQRMAEMLENTQLYDEAYDDGMQVIGEPSVRSGSGRRYVRNERRRRHDTYAE
ncbi:hypothetical protein BST61_g3030 [Cercospora zeina]